MSLTPKERGIMGIAEDFLARLATIGEDLKNEGHRFGEEIVNLVQQLKTAEAPVVAEAETDAKQVAGDAEKAAEPVLESAVTTDLDPDGIIAPAAVQPVDDAGTPIPTPDAEAPASEVPAATEPAQQ